ncbi:hypothetical protein C2E23DRAFT_799529 [Lenzites betulinus]|nr:hypothetical protein C2E23DRAFT_799529 [Lenzites betulinus]
MQCLQIAEIFSQVLFELDGYVYDSRLIPCLPRIQHRQESTLRALASLARTCQTFKEPALDLLWRDIPDLSVLVRYLLPEDLLKYDESSKILKLIGEPTADVWARLDPYITRIRTVGIALPYGVVARGLDSETILRPLVCYLSARAADNDVLLPHLQHVMYQGFWINKWYTRLLLPPYLQILELPTMAHTPSWKLMSRSTHNPITMLACIKNLKKLALHVNPSLQKMHTLRTLLVQAALLDQTTFTHLGALRSLTSLAWENGWSSIRYSSRAETGIHAFRALRQVSVSTRQGSGPLFLRCIDSPALKDVNIHWEILYTHPGASDVCLYKMLTTVAEHHSPERITVVLDKLQEAMIDTQVATNPAAHHLHGSMFYEFLQPVLNITTLRVLEVGINVIFEMSHEALLDLAEKLPRLESLRFAPSLRGAFSFAHEEDPDAAIDIPDLKKLSLFTERCANLKKLSLAVQGCLSGDATRSADSVVKHSSSPHLRYLELWTTALAADEPDEEFIEFFVDTFPGLEELCVVLPFKATDPRSRKVIHRARSRWESVVRGVALSVSGLQWKVV